MIPAGSTAPDVALVDESGTEHPLRSIAGLPTLLVFFKTDCPVSPEVVPVYAAWRRHEPSVQVVGVSQDEPAETRRFLDEVGVSLPVFFDQAPYPVSRGFQVAAVPAAALMVEGRLTWTGEGWQREKAERLATQLASLAGDEPILENADDLPPFKPG